MSALKNEESDVHKSDIKKPKSSSYDVILKNCLNRERVSLMVAEFDWNSI